MRLDDKLARTHHPTRESLVETKKIISDFAKTLPMIPMPRATIRSFRPRVGNEEMKIFLGSEIVARGPRLTKAELELLPVLSVRIPPMDGTHPFNTGLQIEKYTEETLRKHSERINRRTDFFEKTLLGICLATGQELVPYAFRTPDSAVRSLDAGCLGFLLNRPIRDLGVELDDAGFIRSVRPAPSLYKRHEALGADNLRRRVSIIEPEAKNSAVVDEPLDFDPKAPIDERLMEESIRAIRQGANDFRRQIVERWGGVCPLSGVSLTSALDAAHIHPYGGAKTNDLRNGILLRADLHRLFDAYLLSFRYESNNLVFAATDGVCAQYPQLDGFTIESGNLPSPRPHPDVVAQHFKEFSKRADNSREEMTNR